MGSSQYTENELFYKHTLWKQLSYNWISVTNAVKILVCISRQNQRNFAMSVDGLRNEDGASVIYLNMAEG